MCQLSFANFNNKDLNLLWTTNQAILNSDTTHQDGFGLFTQAKGIWKTKLPPSVIVNFGEEIKPYIINNDPVLFHVRLASLINGVRKAETIYSHPFETKKLVLAHNGSLALKINTKDVKYNDLIDSQVFLSRLDKLYIPKKNTILEALTETMNEFEGKFAFLIYDKVFKKYYAIRGKTADLYYYDIILTNKVYNEETKKWSDVDGEKIGYVINTEKIDLFDGIIHFNNLANIIYGINIKILEHPTKELEKESIFLLDKTEILKVGELKENDKFPYVNRSMGWYGNEYYEDAIPYWKREELLKKGVSETTRILEDFIREYDISVAYLDEMFINVFGTPILGATQEDFNMFTKNLIPFIKKYTKKEVKKEWRRLMNVWLTNGLNVHVQDKTLVQFPYMLEKNSINLRILKKNARTL